MDTILTESLKDKEKQIEGSTRYFLSEDIEYVLDRIAKEISDTDEEYEEYELKIRDLIDRLGKVVTIEEVDDSHIVEEVLPTEYVDRAESEILKLSNPVEEELQEIKDDIDYLTDSDFLSKVGVMSPWVKHQLADFIDYLHLKSPNTPEEYLLIKDKSVLE